MSRTVLIGATMALLAGASPLAQDRTTPVDAGMEQIAVPSPRTDAPRATSPTESPVTQLTQRAQGALIITGPQSRGVPDVPQLTRGGAGVRLPTPPAEAVDLCTTGAEPPPGLDCTRVLEAVAANAPPETRLLQPSPSPAAGEGREDRAPLEVNADQVAQRLRTDDLAGSPVAQAVAAARGETPMSSSPSPSEP